MTDWQPIDTVPKDHQGETFLLVVEEDGERNIVTAFWQPPWEENPDGGWYFYPADGNHLVQGKPTHWAQLPSLPA